jgi:hypothetical protein
MPKTNAFGGPIRETGQGAVVISESEGEILLDFGEPCGRYVGFSPELAIKLGGQMVLLAAALLQKKEGH